ncbi:3-isopropylmalate dehydratase small subunit [Glaciimonas sp. PAMC28666]|uniref:3-isopropylmalate dehydratase small subunit n=1 Tax=Glaciimonas sp. PAMC28666 TaxID=2807626 RepID=UPI001962EA4A|nr:3-isopropylmalate dehydratase small subunit [Glaciimonas sp. PAMC28666]QRX81814.1 3-isopropylmalate dehydratase small subunit [Glaciimonas sp. PAMC28666]
MSQFIPLHSVAAPLDRANVDTDAIIPKQFMKSVHRTGFGKNLFDEWRYLDRGEPEEDNRPRAPNPDFILNHPVFEKAAILLARANFGCGSSREHAVWALSDFGIRAIIAPSFGDIFFGNCIRNGIVPIVLSSCQVDEMFCASFDSPGTKYLVDLEAQLVFGDKGKPYSFAVSERDKNLLLHGGDEIAFTMKFQQEIERYEAVRRLREPWIR